MLPDLAEHTIDRLRATLAEAGLGLVVDTGVIDVETLTTIVPLATRAGAQVVRATVSTVLEGARFQLAGGWSQHLAEMRRRLVALQPVLEANHVVLALENHQDTTSDELIELCQAGGPRVGITLDVANPLAVGEDPLLFAAKVGPWIRNVHLKDYRIYPTASGFRLVRSALGDGVIPFPELLTLLDRVAPTAPQNIELAALYARHIRLLEDDWWQSYPACDVRQVLPALRFAARYAQPMEAAWQTPWELDATPDEVGAYERGQLEASVAYLRREGAI